MYPAEILRAKAAPIERVNDEVRAVAERMIELMYEARGIGLAAPQVGLPWRLFVVHVPQSEDEDESGSSAKNSGGVPNGKGTPGGAVPESFTDGPRVYINPVLLHPSGAAEPHEEGCLSLPDIRGDVLRPPHITITATDLKGHSATQAGTGLLARCWQHEMDHLDGVLIIDRFTQMSRMKNRVALRELEQA